MNNTTNERLDELADFLRTRRSRLTPAQVGLPAGRRRRTAGLRREEVAELAEISLTWYSWLEQSRPVNVSPRTAVSIANALQLNESERAHLFQLLDHPELVERDIGKEQVDPLLMSILHGLPQHPAYLINHLWDVVAWNKTANKIFKFSEIIGTPNFLSLIFLDARYREISINWEADARDFLAHFRTDYSKNVSSDDRLEKLVQSIQQRSPDFSNLWERHDVIQRSGWQKQVMLESVGLLTLQTVVLERSIEMFPRMIVYIPTPECAVLVEALGFSS